MLLVSNRLVVSYFCLPFDDIDEGQAIYDRSFIRSLRNVGITVNVYPVQVKRSLKTPFPVWNRGAVNCLDDFDCKSADTFVIISHESLSFLCCYLKPGLFIVHNLFCSFEFKSKPHIQILYRLGSERIYRQAFDASENVLLLSHREKRIAETKYNREFICEPPGIYMGVGHKVKKLSTKHFRRCGSAKWLPKKVSLVSERLILDKFLSEDILDVNLHRYKDTCRCYGLIEDKFLSGFKLKFIQMYYEGDLILSQVSLKEELLALGLDELGYYYVEDFYDLKVNELSSVPGLLLNDEDLRLRQDRMSKVYSWDAIVRRVLFKIFGDSLEL